MKYLFKISFVFLFFFVVYEGIALSEIDHGEVLRQADELYYSDPDSSYKLCKTLNENELTKDQQADLAMILARYNVLTTDYESAEVELQKAMKIYEELGSQKGIARVYGLQSILAERLGENDRSLKLVKMKYQILVDINDVPGQVNPLINLSGSYLLLNQPDSALIFLKKLDGLKDLISETSYYFYYQNWGRYYVQVGEYLIAEENFNKALKVAEENEMIDSKATLLMTMGDMYLLKGDFQNAVKFANMSYAFSEVHGLIYEKKDALIVLVNIAETEKDFLAAFKYQKELTELNDEILNIEKINNVKKVKAMLDIAEQQKVIAMKDTQIAESELEATNAKFTNRIFMFSLIAIMLILGLVGYAFVKTKKLNNIISEQHQSLEIKNHQLSEALTDIEGSINYSKLIQNTLLPGENSWKKFFAESFTIFLPRDKVSGDFYWNYEDEKYVYFCVADCTGHGVPGAMVSVVGMNALEAAVSVEKISSPGKILDRLAEIVERTFSNEETSMKDGMDIAFCRLNKESKELVYAGANNPLYLVNGKGLSIFKANKQPIGKHEDRVPFTEEIIALNEGDSIYLFSDGYADQFGGPQGKKFMYKALRTIIEDNRSRTMNEQKEVLLTSFVNWKEGYEQVDDVCVVGLRV
ncbi:MAG: SpoIIE family protein phosphatase [Flavobacteriales bacterium]|nr:SpoIIE family protein phosphatase [Flavobacteriales bacterium]